MPSIRQQRGAEAEHQAAELLQAKGYIILDRHLTSRYGEIDILAQDDHTIVAIEVKFRRSKKFGPAAESVTNQKLEKIEAALNDILIKRGWQGRPVRIDVVTIEPEGIQHIIGVDTQAPSPEQL